ncbi:squalene synthase [Tripterygium wilfordii]|uniref:Squalene synthase n=1 Tax=Tripterygium wilfordii TaxID=458696 RepID=A0A7J7BZB8_TRIWF|nr:squalene synthase [Tripterygium wilfordii]
MAKTKRDGYRVVHGGPRVRSTSVGINMTQEVWCPSPVGCVKLNCDAALTSDSYGVWGSSAWFKWSGDWLGVWMEASGIGRGSCEKACGSCVREKQVYGRMEIEVKGNSGIYGNKRVGDRQELWKIGRRVSKSEREMESLGTMLKHLDDLYPLLKLKMEANRAVKQIPLQPHWSFCYTVLHKVSRSFALVIQQLGPHIRDNVCVYYLVLRALDTVEDDPSIPTDVKVPILKTFHQHLYERDWHFSCGTKEDKKLMNQFHHVSTAFLELGKGCQEVIEEITQRMGAGMAKFICKEVETIDDYDEYCHYVSGLVGLGLSKLFHDSGLEDLAPESLSNTMGLLLEKMHIIRDYPEDIEEKTESRMFWPREIWSKYVNKLEDLKYEENSSKAVKCLNDMVTNSLIHVEDCLKYMSSLRDPAILRFCAIPQIVAIGTLALCYNNVEVFRSIVKMRRGLTAKVFDRTRTMSDVYGAFYEFSCILRSKVDKDDPNSTITLSRLDAIQKTCLHSGALNRRKSYMLDNESKHGPLVLFILLSVLGIIISKFVSRLAK